MKRAIVYCTNADKLAELDIDCFDYINSTQSNDSTKNHFEIITEDTNSKIVLVFDKLYSTNQKAISEIKQTLYDYQFNYVYHTNQSHELVKILAELEGSLNTNGFKDIHESSGNNISKYYIKLKNIIESNSLTKNLFDQLWHDFSAKNDLEQTLEELVLEFNKFVVEKLSFDNFETNNLGRLDKLK